MFPILFRWGPVTLHTYGLLVALGFLAGVAVSRKTFAAAYLPAALVDRFSFLALASGLLGARVMFFAVDGFRALAHDPLSFFRIWEGGLVFYGGVAGALIALVIATCRRKIPFIVITDAFAPGLLIAHALGRLGCFAAGCCYGKPSGFWPGVIFKHPETLAPPFVALHPTQIYEAVALALLFMGAMALLETKPPVGRMTWFYLVTYPIVRFLIEMLRGDDRGRSLLGLSPSQTVSIAAFVAGVAVFIYVERPQDS